ncbi:hypothetical protein LINPERHAP1_LOCUS11759, partial [Linum perenne]
MKNMLPLFQSPLFPSGCMSHHNHVKQQPHLLKLILFLFIHHSFHYDHLPTITHGFSASLQYLDALLV